MRWTPKRKAALIREIAAGRLSEVDACLKYDLSADELSAWKHDFGSGGIEGLVNFRDNRLDPEVKEHRKKLRRQQTREGLRPLVEAAHALGQSVTARQHGVSRQYINKLVKAAETT